MSALAHQTHVLDAIYLVLPRVFLRDWVWYENPFWYMHHSGAVQIVRCEQDFKPETGLLCALQYEPDPDTYMLIVDDDQVFHPMLVEGLVSESIKRPGAMIGAVSYWGNGGVWCREHDRHGVCINPNLVHSTFGILFQRRFFDAGILNHGAVAKAYMRLRPDKPIDLNYVLTSCMIQGNLWYEAHLARKGIPRVFLKNYFGAYQVADLAYGREALFSGFQDTYHHDKRDPQTIDEAEQLCKRALVALWGPSIWAARSRRVAAVQIKKGLSLSAAASAVAVQLGKVGWWSYDSIVFFACTGFSVTKWREALRLHGGLQDRIFYLHRFFLGSGGPEDRNSFVSELFDPEAFMPEPLRTRDADQFQDKWGKNIRGFGPSPGVPDHETAGTSLPLADVVELCPAGTPSSERPPLVAEALLQARRSLNCPAAKMLRHSCDPGAAIIEEAEPDKAWASVRCCWDSKGNPEQNGPRCLNYWVNRNISWGSDQELMGCLPQFATYYDAHRTCEVLGLTLCAVEDVTNCCGLGCAINPVTWVHSPDAEECVKRSLAEFRKFTGLPMETSMSGDPYTEEIYLRKQEESFMSIHEEARSTVVEWLSEISPPSRE
eukprot:TRINITY_DN9746_c0_g1_i1.p1 TRINITY_DN9746_c0_g1~~TRINITY_DN9746_c0_g1_i1.p1  ORF type:complete len:629 (-),score=92.68 TRINITY_DN9746_c0_g1_i1:211-2019(-)